MWSYVQWSLWSPELGSDFVQRFVQTIFMGFCKHGDLFVLKHLHLNISVAKVKPHVHPYLSSIWRSGVSGFFWLHD